MINKNIIPIHCFIKKLDYIKTFKEICDAKDVRVIDNVLTISNSMDSKDFKYMTRISFSENKLSFNNIQFDNISFIIPGDKIILNSKTFTKIRIDNEEIVVSNIQELIFFQCKVVEDIHLGNSVFSEFIPNKFTSLFFSGEVKTIVMNNFVCEKYVRFFLRGESDKINISNCNFGEQLEICNFKENTNEDYENPKLRLKSLEIKNCTVGNEAYLRFSFLKCDKFVLSNLRNPKDAEVNIGECIFKKFYLANFINMGKFKIYNIESEENEEDTKFQIDNTSIGDADFQNINFKSFNKVIMYANIFSNLHYTILKWKDDILADEGNTQSKNKIEIQQDTYRALKNVATRNNDKPQALIFFAKEMKSYKKLMLETNSKGINGDIFTLRFNEWTNNFGLSWTKPLILLLVSSFIFYTLLLFSINTNEIIPEIIFKKFFIFVNPIHKVEFIFENCWGFWSYFIDSVFRIIEGLLVYQMIQGFRKYSRIL